MCNGEQGYIARTGRIGPSAVELWTFRGQRAFPCFHHILRRLYAAPATAAGSEHVCAAHRDGCRPYVEIWQGGEIIVSTLQDYENLRHFNPADRKVRTQT